MRARLYLLCILCSSGEWKGLEHDRESWTSPWRGQSTRMANVGHARFPSPPRFVVDGSYECVLYAHTHTRSTQWTRARVRIFAHTPYAYARVRASVVRSHMYITCVRASIICILYGVKRAAGGWGVLLPTTMTGDIFDAHKKVPPPYEIPIYGQCSGFWVGTVGGNPREIFRADKFVRLKEIAFYISRVGRGT